jgi:hypothetical protein
MASIKCNTQMPDNDWPTDPDIPGDRPEWGDLPETKPRG